MDEPGSAGAAPRGAEEPAYDIERWRREIRLLDRFIPLNNCSQAPQTARTRAAALAYLDSWQRDGMNWDAWLEEVRLCKAEFARLINAAPEEIAVTTSVSAATASLASALDLERGRNRVVVTDAEFPAVGHVWRAHRKYGLEIDRVPVRDGEIEPDVYDALIGADTVLVSACHGYYLNGFKQDLRRVAEEAHSRGAWIYTDAYQTLGTCVVDVKEADVDFLSSGVLKYLMGTPGIAFLYVRAELIDRLEPAVTGWFGRRNPFAFDAATLDWAPTADRFDTGTPGVFNAYVARAGMSIINEIGGEHIQAWTETLSQRLIDNGRDRGLRIHGTSDVRRKTPSTAFLCPFDSHRVEARLRERGIMASARGPVIRLAPHFYNTLDEMDRAVDVLAGIFAGE